MPKLSQKAQIRQTGEALFLRFGIKRVSVEEICREAGVSKMTFYKHFKSKIDLMNDIWQRWMEERCVEMKKIDVRDMTIIDKLLIMFKMKTDFLSSFSPEFLNEALQLDLDFQVIMDELEAILKRAQHRGEIRTGLRPFFILSVLESFYTLSKNSELMSRYRDLRSFRKEAMDFFLYGISPRPQAEEEE